MNREEKYGVNREERRKNETERIQVERKIVMNKAITIIEAIDKEQKKLVLATYDLYDDGYIGKEHSGYRTELVYCPDENEYDLDFDEFAYKGLHYIEDDEAFFHVLDGKCEYVNTSTLDKYGIEYFICESEEMLSNYISKLVYNKNTDEVPEQLAKMYRKVDGRT